MPVTVDQNYNVEVTPEYWLLYLKHRLPKNLRKKLYNNPELLPGYTNLLQGTLYFNANLPSYNNGIELYYTKKRDEYENKIEDYVQEASKRLYNVYREAGSPMIFQRSLIPLTYENGEPRAHTFNIPYSPIFNINDFDDLVAELSHPIQNKYGSNKAKLLPEITRHFNRQKDAEVYRDPTHLEWETHSFFEPQIKDYINKNITPKWLKINNH